MAVDTLIVLGYGPVTAGGKLNVYARLTALAAGLLLARQEARQVLISGGRTGGDALPSEAALMAEYLTRAFRVHAGQVQLEEAASDTLENLVFSANLLDREGFAGSLGFLALQMHLPRVQSIAQLVSLKGEPFATEAVVATRSRRHHDLLETLKHTPSYVRLAASQVRAMRGLQSLPAFWLPPLAELSNPARVQALQAHPVVQTLGLPENLERFRHALRALPRCFPEAQPDDERRALELIHA